MEDVLKATFAKGLGVDGKSVVWENLEYRKIPQWDSLAHMQLVEEIEDSFNVMLETDDVIALSSFNQAKVILSKYGVVFE
jgi:acyl carrier protein